MPPQLFNYFLAGLPEFILLSSSPIYGLPVPITPRPGIDPHCFIIFFIKYSVSYEQLRLCSISYYYIFFIVSKIRQTQSLYLCHYAVTCSLELFDVPPAVIFGGTCWLFKWPGPLVIFGGRTFRRRSMRLNRRTENRALSKGASLGYPYQYPFQLTSSPYTGLNLICFFLKQILYQR